ncbi:hypothetical protein, partial [Streptomyces sp. NPDC001388]|uniref:hypothetical protein n=1 Tax=Streptomyces sp. NPDC001388 TaxID=3364568 RepID=UPI0036A65A1B
AALAWVVALSRLPVFAWVAAFSGTAALARVAAFSGVAVLAWEVVGAGGIGVGPSRVGGMSRTVPAAVGRRRTVRAAPGK